MMLTRAEQYRQAVDHMPIDAESPRGFVEVSRNDRGEVSVRLRRGALGRLDDRELSQEIQGGLAAALDEYARRARELRRHYFVASAEFLDPEPTAEPIIDSQRSHRG